MRVLTLFVAGTLSMAGLGRVHADDWQGYNGHTYRITTTVGNWDQAEAEAVAAGGHLVTINDAGESEWLLDTFTAPLGCWWIGLHQLPILEEHPADGWEWTSGELVTFTASNWGPSGEPNDDGGSHHEYWAQMWAGSPGTRGYWNDLGPQSIGYQDQPGIIEVVPEPATLSLLLLTGMGLLRFRKR